MNMNAWGDDVGLAGLLSIGIQVAGLFCLMVWLIGATVLGALLKKLTGRENAFTRRVGIYVECSYCHREFHPRAIDQHIQEKHPISYREIARQRTIRRIFR